MIVTYVIHGLSTKRARELMRQIMEVDPDAIIELDDECIEMGITLTLVTTA